MRDKIQKTHRDTWNERKDRLKNMTYKQYLKSHEWKLIKAKAYNRDCYSKCAKCGTSDNLDLHHTTYKWIHTLTPMRGLVSLCRNDHENVHTLAQKYNISVSLATSNYLKGSKPVRIKKKPKLKLKDRMRVNSYAYKQSLQPKKVLSKESFLARKLAIQGA